MKQGHGFIYNKQIINNINTLKVNSNKNENLITSKLPTYNTPSHKLENEKVVNLLNNKLSSTTIDSNNEFDSYKLKKSNFNHSSITHYPPANKEWVNSIYSYNKNYIKSLPIADNLVHDIIKSYFSIDPLFNGKKSNIRTLLRKKYSLNKIFVSKAEVKHTSDKINLTVYLYNRKKKTVLETLKRLNKSLNIRKFSSKIGLEKPSNIKNKIVNLYNLFKLENKKSFISSLDANPNNLSKNYIYITKTAKNHNKLFITNLNQSKRLKKFTVNSVKLIKKALVIKKNLIKLINVKYNNKLFSNFENKYYLNFLNSYYLKEMLYFYYVKSLSFNNKKFNNSFILGLKKVVSKLYNKKVELNLVNQKYFYLNSDIFIKILSNKLKDRKSVVLKEMRKALSKVVLPEINIKELRKKNSFFNFNKKPVDTMQTFNILQDNIIKSIKYKHINGIRLEAAGRLSRRLTAARSVFKLAYTGTLKNSDLLYKKKSIFMLRGHVKPNLQYTSINMKTRNGAFGLKGWVNNN